MSKLINFERVYSFVTDFSNMKTYLTAELLNRAIDIINSTLHFLSCLTDTQCWLLNTMIY